VTEGTVGVGAGAVGTETVAATVVEGSVGVPSGSAGAAAAPAAANGISAPQIFRTDLQRRSIPNRIRVRGRFTAGEMRLEQDYYEVLGVSRGATGEEIKRAFRALARRLHPDVAEGEPAQNGFHEALEAYRVLSHPRRRTLYDRLGIGPRRSLPAAAAAPAPLRLEWWEAERGASKLVEVDDAVGCPECLGRGVPCGVAPAVCIACHGSGRVNRVTETESVRLLEVQPCAVCAGRGRAAAAACRTCDGRGTATARRAIRVRTPANVRDGDILQVPGIAQRFVLEVNLRPRDSIAVLLVSAVALAAAVVLFVYLVMR
jgi:DnaJ-class molecular chaperone